MKFKNIGSKHIAGLYGYTFPLGGVCDVTEENLIKKFRKYSWLEAQDVGQEGKQDEGQEGQEGEEGQDADGALLTRDELKARADELGIVYSPKAFTSTLRKLLQDHM